MKVFNLVVIFVISLADCKKTYKVGVFENDIKILGIRQYVSMIKQAATENIKVLAETAKETSMFVAVLLFNEMNQDDNKMNVIFDRNGTVVATNKKATNTALFKIGRFTSSFGVLFRILQEDDLALHKIDAFKNVKNFILLGASKVSNLASLWAYATKSNVITSSQIFGSKTVYNAAYKLVIAVLNKYGAEITDTLKGHSLMMPVDVEASIQGYEDTVCHEEFCCEFYIKSHLVGSANNKMNYALIALDDGQSYCDNTLKVENCAVLAYTGLYEYAADFRLSQNNSNVKFTTIIITHNKTNHNHPVITDHTITSKQFIFTSDSTKAIINNTNKSMFNEMDRNSTGGFLTREHLGEMFDYIWIKVRIILFVVSIYILEMM